MDQQAESSLEVEHRETALRMAFSLLKRWHCQLNRDDVEGMAGVALCRAAQQFDPGLGSKFESYLFYYVRAELIRAIEDAISARKAVEALRDSVPELKAVSEPGSDTDEQTLPDPDRIAAAQPKTPEGAMLINEQAEQVRLALSQLEEPHREILELVFFKQVHPQEIKDKLGLTRSGIRRTLDSAKKALKKELKKAGIEGEFEE